VSRRLDYEKARREARMRSGKYKPSVFPTKLAAKQEGFQKFVKVENLACFRCHRRTPSWWGATGRRKSGLAWAICLDCVKKRDTVKGSVQT